MSGREKTRERERKREQDPEGNALRLQSSSAGPLIKGGPWENEFLEEGEGPRSTIDSLAASYKDRSRYGEACVPLKLFIVGSRELVAEAISRLILSDLRDSSRNIEWRSKHRNLERSGLWRYHSTELIYKKIALDSGTNKRNEIADGLLRGYSENLGERHVSRERERARDMRKGRKKIAGSTKENEYCRISARDFFKGDSR